MKPEIKVCGMAEASQIDALSGVDWFGMIFWPLSSRNALSLNPESITNSETRRVGVFVDADPDAIRETVRKFNLDVVQFHGSESAEDCRALKASGVEVWKAFAIRDEADLKRISRFIGSVDRVLLDTKTDVPGGSGLKFNWNLLEKYEYDLPFMLAGGIGPDDAEDLRKISHPRFAGIDINSKFELRPGVKDLEKIADFIARIRSHNEN